MSSPIYELLKYLKNFLPTPSQDNIPEDKILKILKDKITIPLGSPVYKDEGYVEYSDEIDDMVRTLGYDLEKFIIPEKFKHMDFISDLYSEPLYDYLIIHWNGIYDELNYKST